MIIRYDEGIANRIGPSSYPETSAVIGNSGMNASYRTSRAHGFCDRSLSAYSVNLRRASISRNSRSIPCFSVLRNP